MVKNLFNHKTKIALATIFVLLLVLIRAYENSLFYDPFLDYFKVDYHNLPIPVIDNLQLFAGLFFRYFLNTVLSLSIIYVLFKDIDSVKFASVLYLIFFVVLVGAFFFILLKNGEPNKMGLFYVRRFLIQPLFLLLFLPAFYYQKQKQ
jgi:exosortase F-associated protein